jgi:hypothetical protein
LLAKRYQFSTFAACSAVSFPVFSIAHQVSVEEKRQPADGNYTPQLPPSNPIVTFTPSTMTGTLRTPRECFSMVYREASSVATLKYFTGRFSLANAARAARVYGQASFPNNKIFGAIFIPFRLANPGL